MNNNQRQWNLAALAESDNNPSLVESRAKANQIIEKFCQKWTNDPRYLTDTSFLRRVLDELEEVERSVGLNSQEWYYFNLRSAQDQLNPQIKARFNQANEVAIKLFNKIQFFELSLAKISTDQQSIFLNSKDLQPYKHYLERLFATRSHLLNQGEEKILSMLETPARNAWISMTSSLLSNVQKEITDDQGQTKLKTFTEILSLTNDTNKQVRDQAAQHVHQVTKSYADIATDELNAILNYKKTIDELRDYSRPDQDRHLSDDIESDVVDRLVERVSNRFDISHRYYQLKAKIMHQDSLAYHERNIPIGKIEDQYAYEEAVSLVSRVLCNLDNDFGEIFEEFNNNDLIDAFPRPGKVGGAFCAHNLITQPTYILLNHTDTLQDVLTLAHEVGHGIHNELARKHQNSLNFGTSLATAEVASTFMEDFILEELLKSADRETRIAISMMKLNDDISSIFRQIACYNFESDLHQQYREQGYLSKEAIGELFNKHMSAYMGPAVRQDEGSQNWWVYWSHIRNYFYVYSYASGLLISKSLQNLVRKDNTNINAVKQFMQAGQSRSPKDIFKAIDIDITSNEFWDNGLKEIEHHLNSIENEI